MQLRLKQIIDHGESELALLSGEGEYFIGRNPEGANVIKIDAPMVSRNHGVIVHAGKNWFYSDIGSTNGSWLDEKKLNPEEWYLLKPNCSLQIGDVLIKINMEALSDVDEVESLLVFNNNEFVEERSVPAFGKALVIGDSKDFDFEIEGVVSNSPLLVIEKRSTTTSINMPSSVVAAYINDNEIRGPMRLKDGDEIKIGKYKIIYSDFKNSEIKKVEIQSNEEGFVETDHEAEIRPRKNTSKSFIFEDEEEVVQKEPINKFFGIGNIQETSDDDSYTPSLGEVSSRYRGPTLSDLTEKKDTVASFEKKLLIAAVVILLIAIVIALSFFII